MKKPRLENDLNPFAVKRVSSLFSQGIHAFESLLAHLFDKQHLISNHQCYIVKLPRYPVGIQNVKPKNRKTEEKQGVKKSFFISASSLKDKDLAFTSKMGEQAFRAQRCCSQHPKDFLLLSEEALHMTLTPDRVKSLRLKEHLFAARRLKSLDKENESKGGSRAHQITQYSEKNSKEEEGKKQQELWQDMIKLKEERQFQITRIIKYLSD